MSETNENSNSPASGVAQSYVGACAEYYTRTRSGDVQQLPKSKARRLIQRATYLGHRQARKSMVATWKLSGKNVHVRHHERVST